MIKWIKRLLNKYSTAESAVAASITINAAELKYRPDGYIADTLAALIAQELVRRDLITIEQLYLADTDKRAFVGKIEIVLRG